MNTLMKHGANDSQLTAAANSLGALHFDNTCSRSVQGTLNQMVGDIEHILHYQNASLPRMAKTEVAQLSKH